MGDKVSGRQRGRGVDRSKSGVSPAARKLLLHLSLHCALGVSDTLGQQHLTLFLVCPSCYHVSKSCFCSDVDNANCRTKGFFPVFPFPYQPHTNIWRQGSWQPQNPILALRTRIPYSTHQSPITPPASRHEYSFRSFLLREGLILNTCHPRLNSFSGVWQSCLKFISLSNGKFLKVPQFSIYTWVSNGFGNGEIFPPQNNRDFIFTNIKLLQLINPLGQVPTAFHSWDQASGFTDSGEESYCKTTDLMRRPQLASLQKELCTLKASGMMGRPLLRIWVGGEDREEQRGGQHICCRPSRSSKAT